MKIYIFFISFIITAHGFCQSTAMSTLNYNNLENYNSYVSKKKLQNSSVYKKNDIKINVSSLLLNNYSLYIERSLTRKISAQLGYRFQPASNTLENSTIKSAVLSFIDLDGKTESKIDETYITNQTFTGEIRFYAGKKGGSRGFYAAIYSRYAFLDVNLPIYGYYASNGIYYKIPLIAKVKGFGAGVLFGVVWWIRKTVSIDFYIIGGHYGSWKGSILGEKDLSALAESDKEAIKTDLENSYRMNNKNLIYPSVINTGIKGTVRAPYFGARAGGLSLGLVF